jgi:hypothetical protein
MKKRYLSSERDFVIQVLINICSAVCDTIPLDWIKVVVLVISLSGWCTFRVRIYIMYILLCYMIVLTRYRCSSPRYCDFYLCPLSDEETEPSLPPSIYIHRWDGMRMVPSPSSTLSRWGIVSWGWESQHWRSLGQEEREEPQLCFLSKVRVVVPSLICIVLCMCAGSSGP